MSNPAYPNALPAEAVIRRLAEACRSAVHEFWPDDLSLLDTRVANPGRILSSRQITDLYLLGLAVAHKGRLVSFDKSMALEAIVGATARHVLTL
jgi:hypothetical protein